MHEGIRSRRSFVKQMSTRAEIAFFAGTKHYSSLARNGPLDASYSKCGPKGRGASSARSHYIGR